MKSVCMATYNGSEFIKRQLDSIVQQLDTTDEVIIVDDNSTDGTTKIILDNYSSNQVKLIKNNKNIGSIGSFEKAMSKASGEFIFLADQDDIWFDNKVEVMMDLFKTGADLIVHDAIVVNGNLEEIDESWNHYNHNHVTSSIIKNTIKNGYTGCMMAFRNTILREVLPFPKKIEMHDQWIAQVSMKNNKSIVCLEQPLMYYVRHGGNVTGMKKRKKLEQLTGRLNTLMAIMKYKKNDDL